RQVLEVEQRRVAGAEVVERDAYAVLGQPAQVLGRAVEVGDERVLGDLDGQLGRAQTAAADRRPHGRHQRGADDVRRGDVDRDTGCPPRRRLAAGGGD